MGEAIEANKLLPMTENKMTTAMLVKLFATTKVASSFLGFSSNETIKFAIDGFWILH